LHNVFGTSGLAHDFGLIRAVVGIVIALTSLGTAMLAPEAWHISTAVPAITDFSAITTALDPPI
jgi:hypothetical protein